jgi:hypothetical protein
VLVSSVVWLAPLAGAPGTRDRPPLAQRSSFRRLQEFIAPPLSSLRMRTLSGGARHFVEKQHLREDPIPPPHLHALKK